MPSINQDFKDTANGCIWTQVFRDWRAVKATQLQVHSQSERREASGKVIFGPALTSSRDGQCIGCRPRRSLLGKTASSKGSLGERLPSSHSCCLVFHSQHWQQGHLAKGGKIVSAFLTQHRNSRLSNAPGRAREVGRNRCFLR